MAAVACALGLGLACGGRPAELMNGTSGDPVEVPPWACVPGESRACACPELDGVQVCDAQGAAFGACDCSPGAVSQGPPPTGEGSGTGDETASGSDGSTTAATSSGPGTTGTESTGPGDPTTSAAGTSSGGAGSSSTG